MGRRPIGEIARTPAENQRFYRARLKQAKKRAPLLEKQRRRAEREQKLAAATARAWQMLCDRTFPVLYVDPPWRVEPYSRETGLNRAADNHYPTIPLDEIKALKLPAAKDCVLFLWVLAEMFDEATDVIRSWGFASRTSCMWEKAGGPPGMGHWFRFYHEQLVVAARGIVPAPAPGLNWDSVIKAPRGKHSEKPEAVADMITAYYPNCPKLEMFYRPLDDPELERERRAKREAVGWYIWGNEVEEAAA